MISKQLDGSYIVTDASGLDHAIPAGLSDADLEARIATALGVDLSMPEEIERDRVMMFLAATKRTSQVRDFLQTRFGDVAAAEFDSFRTFHPTSALGQAVKVAMFGAGEDADRLYASDCRTMAATTVDDYGDPKPLLREAIARFFTGG